MDGQTDGQTDRRTDRDARTHLKSLHQENADHVILLQLFPFAPFHFLSSPSPLPLSSLFPFPLHRPFSSCPFPSHPHHPPFPFTSFALLLLGSSPVGPMVQPHTRNALFFLSPPRASHLALRPSQLATGPSHLALRPF